MAIQPLYKKFGGDSTDPGRSLISGQAAVGQSLQDALGGIKSLMADAERGYKEENTLNMQQYLKGQVRDNGLGGDTIDRTAIKQKFGNLVDMDQLDKTISTEGKLLEITAIDDASTYAKGILADTKDPLQAREAFAKKMMDANAPNSLINASSQAFNDSIVTQSQDLATIKMQEGLQRTQGVFEAIKNKLDPGMAIETAVSALPEKDQIVERRRLWDEVGEEQELRPDQQKMLDFGMSQASLSAKREVTLKQQLADSIDAKYTEALKSGIPETAYATVDNLSKGLGNSIPNAMADRVNNWIESLSGNSEGQQIRDIHKDLINKGINPRDASAAMTQAFNETYPGDSIWGNDLEPEGLAVVKARSLELSKGVLESKDLSSKLTTARQEVVATEFRTQENILKLRKKLVDAGIATKMGVADATNISDEFQNYLQTKRASASTSIGTANNDSAVVGGYDIGSYATDPNHEASVKSIYDATPEFTNANQIDQYIKGSNPDSPITGSMVSASAEKYGVDPRMLVSIMQQDSSLGTAGKGVRTNNPGNVGNDDAGNEVQYATLAEGVDAAAKELANRKVDKTPPKSFGNSGFTTKDLEARVKKNTGNKPSTRDGTSGTSGVWGDTTGVKEQVDLLMNMSQKQRKSELSRLDKRIGEDETDTLRAALKQRLNRG